MANNENINKVVFGNTTLIDLTNDSVEASNLLEGETAHDRSGTPITGTAKQGHTIWDRIKTALTQRSILQFVGTLQVTDNPTDGATVVDDSAFEISWDDWDAMSAAQQEAFCELHPKVDILDPPSVDGTISAELMKKLWENPSPTSDFNSQTIALSSSDYDFLLWVIKTGKNEAYQYVQISNKANGLLSLAYSTSGGANSEYRDFTLDTATSITLSNCKKAVGTTAQTTANDRMIPLAIYGIKSTINLKLSAIASDVNTAADHCMLSDGVTSVEDVIEYSTTEQVIGKWIDGRTLYRKVIDIGNLPNATAKTVPHGITGLYFCAKLYGMAYRTNVGFVPLPYVNTSVLANGIRLDANYGNITIISGVDYSNYSGYVVMEYTKTS